MLSNHLILSCALLLPPSIFPSIRLSSNESVLHIRWQKYWSFSFTMSWFNEYSGLVSFRLDWLDLLAVQVTLKSFLQHHGSKAPLLWHSAFFTVQLSHPYMTTEKNHSFDYMDLCWKTAQRISKEATLRVSPVSHHLSKANKFTKWPRNTNYLKNWLKTSYKEFLLTNMVLDLKFFKCTFKTVSIYLQKSRKC